MTIPPTPQAYAELQSAYDHFNLGLFSGRLPPCLITFQRKRSTYGYFSGDRFVNTAGVTADEIALNPQFFAALPVREILQTLVHEMVHLWQHHFGSPGRRRYHNKEWATKMESIGLMPSSTGKPGGKKTGEYMSDYVIEGGEFDALSLVLLDRQFQVSWMDRFANPVLSHEAGDRTESSTALGAKLNSVAGEGVLLASKVKASNRVKFHCPSCQASAWGKPSLSLVCGQCGVALIAATGD